MCSIACAAFLPKLHFVPDLVIMIPSERGASAYLKDGDVFHLQGELNSPGEFSSSLLLVIKIVEMFVKLQLRRASGDFIWVSF